MPKQEPLVRLGAVSSVHTAPACVRPPAGDMMLTDPSEMLLHEMSTVHRKSCFLTFANYQISEHNYLNNETQRDVYKLL